MKRLSMIVMGTAALALAACGSDNPDGSAAPSETAPADTAAQPGESMPGTSPEAGAPATAQGFVETIGASDMFEVESSKLAQTMSKTDAVKSFADMMVKDHTKSTADLKAAANQASPRIAVRPKLTAEQQGDLDRLKASGAGFDRLYAELQVAGHERALAALEGYARAGESPPLKEFASKTAVVVSQHFEHAQRLPR